MNIVLLGPSGVGKGTHADALALRFNLRHLASGELFRQHLQRRTPLGRDAERYMADAELVPDAIVDAMVEEWGRTLPAEQGMLCDGFPRTPEQAHFLDEMLRRQGRELNAVVYLKAADEVVLRRLSGRLVCRHCQAAFHRWFNPPRQAGRCDACDAALLERPDDDGELAERRLRIFHRTTEPVLRRYAALGKVVIVPGDGTIEATREALVAAARGILDRTARFATVVEVSALAPPRPLLAAPAARPSLDLVLLGGPGSGKGTQAERLSDALQLPHIATGDLFREHLQQATPLGRLACEFMARGDLVPDDVTEAMVEERLARPDTHAGFVLDGFPRTLAQAEALTEILARLRRRLSAVVYMNVPDDILLRRLSGRLICRGCQASYHRAFNPPHMAGACDRCGGLLSMRADDAPETVGARLVSFHRQTEPLIGAYRRAGLLREIAGEGGVAEIAERVLAAVREAKAAPLLAAAPCPV